MSKSVKPEQTAKGEPLKVKTKSETQFPLDRPISAKVGKDPMIPEGCVVAFFAPERSDALASFVVSRPIGKTPLSTYTWVVNRVKDVPDLKNRAKNPNSKRIDEMRQKLKMKLLADHGYVIGKGSDYELTAKTSDALKGQMYHKYLDRAKQALEADKALAKTAWEEKYKSRPKGMRPKFAYGKQLDSFLTKEESSAQATLRVALIELNFEEKAIESYPDDHVTMIDGVHHQMVLKPVSKDWGWYRPADMLNELAHTFYLFCQGKSESKEDFDQGLHKQIEELKKALEEKDAQIAYLKSASVEEKITLLNAEIFRLNTALGSAVDEIENLKTHMGDRGDDSSPSEEEEEEVITPSKVPT